MRLERLIILHWGTPTHTLFTHRHKSHSLRDTRYWRLDLRESHDRQRLQLLANQNGSPHTTAVRCVDTPPSPFTLPTLLTPPTYHVPASEAPTEDLSVGVGDSDPHVVTPHTLTLPCQLIVLAHMLPGTLLLSRQSISFTPDDRCHDYQEAAQLVSVANYRANK